MNLEENSCDWIHNTLHPLPLSLYLCVCVCVCVCACVTSYTIIFHWFSSVVQYCASSPPPSSKSLYFDMPIQHDWFINIVISDALSRDSQSSNFWCRFRAVVFDDHDDDADIAGELISTDVRLTDRCWKAHDDSAVNTLRSKVKHTTSRVRFFRSVSQSSAGLDLVWYDDTVNLETGTAPLWATPAYTRYLWPSC